MHVHGKLFELHLQGIGTIKSVFNYVCGLNATVYSNDIYIN